MNKTQTPGINELLSLFAETLTPADVLSAKLISQFSNSITSERLRLNMLMPHSLLYHVGNVVTTIFQLIKLLKLHLN